ncbi:hypothetical protein D3C86_2210530 [compost metagenome]
MLVFSCGFVYPALFQAGLWALGWRALSARQFADGQAGGGQAFTQRIQLGVDQVGGARALGP